MNFNHDLGSIESLLIIDTTIAPPLGGQVQSLMLVGSGSVVVPAGTTAERPSTPLAAMLRFNTQSTVMEYYDGTAWSALSTGGGTVTSISITTTDGLTVNGTTSDTITNSGTFALELNAELQSLSNLSSTGIIARTSSGTYIPRTILGTVNNISVANGDGVTGNPTIDLIDTGSPVTASFVKITTDAKGRVSATTAVTTSDITGLVDSTYVNVAGDTMNSGANLTFVGGGEILGLPSVPSDPTAATSKAYVDSVSQGLDPKQSVRAATTVAGTLATSFADGSVIDGITLVTGDRILIKNQLNPEENGIYVVNISGAPTRSSDMNSWSEVPSAYTFVEEGSTLADTGWVCISDQGGTIDTTPIDFVQFTGAGTYTAGTGLTLTGNEFSITSPVSTSLGGTGLTTIGTANQFLSVNVGGTSLEYKTITAGTAISVVPGTGVLTINNTGVTSITGTTDQINVDVSTGDVTLSLPSTITTNSLILTNLTSDSFIYSGTGGEITSTSAPTNGQLLIGNTGNAPTAATLTAGTAIGITNGAGSITINNTGVTSVSAGTGINVSASTGSVTISNTGVTSVNASGGTTGLTFSGGPVTTTGTLTLSGTLNPANGGTGLTSIGSANQILATNNAGNALEFKTLTAGTGISITGGVGTLTVTNTGVTSVALAAPSFLTVSGSPVTTTGTLTLSLATQPANTVFAGPTSGPDAAPTFRSLEFLDLPIELYSENPVSPTTPTTTGDNAVAVGSGSTASGNDTFAVGNGTDARIDGMKAYANGSFATAGDAQHGVYIYRGITTDGTTTEIFLDGASQQLIIPNNAVFTFSITVAARRTDATGGAAGYKFDGVISKDTTAGSLAFIGVPSKTLLGETNLLWDTNITADTSTGALKITVVGQAAKTIRWVATALTTEVTN